MAHPSGAWPSLAASDERLPPLIRPVPIYNPSGQYDSPRSECDSDVSGEWTPGIVSTLADMGVIQLPGPPFHAVMPYAGWGYGHFYFLCERWVSDSAHHHGTHACPTGARATCQEAPQLPSSSDWPSPPPSVRCASRNDENPSSMYATVIARRRHPVAAKRCSPLQKMAADMPPSRSTGLVCCLTPQPSRPTRTRAVWDRRAASDACQCRANLAAPLRRTNAPALAPGSSGTRPPVTHAQALTGPKRPARRLPRAPSRCTEGGPPSQHPVGRRVNANDRRALATAAYCTTPLYAPGSRTNPLGAGF